MAKKTIKVIIDDSSELKPTPMMSIPVPYDSASPYVGNSVFASVVFEKRNALHYYYRARKDVPAGTPLSNTEYWEPISGLERVGIYDAFINHLFTDEAFIRQLRATMITAQRIQTSSDDGAHIIIENGMAEFWGRESKNIEIGVDDNGMAVLSYYDNDGVKLYDLGPNGINRLQANEERWDKYPYLYLSDNSRDYVKLAYEHRYDLASKLDAYIYRYTSQRRANVPKDKEHDLRYFKAENFNNPCNGYYAMIREYEYEYLIQVNSNGYQSDDDTGHIIFDKETLNFNKPIYQIKLVHITDGVIDKTQYFRFN